MDKRIVSWVLDDDTYQEKICMSLAFTLTTIIQVLFADNVKSFNVRRA